MRLMPSTLSHLCLLTLLTLNAGGGGCKDKKPGPHADAALSPDARQPGDGGARDAELRDGAPADAVPPDAGAPDHQEGDSAGNDPFHGGSVEETGAALSPGATATFAGSVDPQSPPDADAFAFEVTIDATVQAEATWVSDSAPTPLYLGLHQRSDNHLQGGWALSATGAALTVPVRLPAGSYFVTVAPASDGPGAALPYTIVLRTLSTPPPATPASPAYIESSAAQRDNDALRLSWSPAPELAQTSGAGDAPEQTGVALVPGQVVRIDGVAGSVDTAGDSYRDRDAFAITAGSGLTRLTVRLAPTASPSVTLLHLLLVDAAAPTRVAGAGFGFDPAAQGAVIRTTAGHTYWVWVGALDLRPLGISYEELPAAYQLTLVGE